jgi:exonuclease III
MGKIISNGTGRSCGVILLYNDTNWECERVEVDTDGRYIVAHLCDKKNSRDLLIANIYAPNDFNESHIFFNNLFEIIGRIKNSIPNQQLELCLLGDFNFVVDETQCVNRNHSPAEKRLSNVVNRHLENLDLMDTLCHDKNPSVHTWTARGICSRLDRIYCNQPLFNKICSLDKSWGIAKSDHALISLQYVQTGVSRGPGIKGLKSTLLKNPKFVLALRQELSLWINSIPEGWNPHQKWDFCKVGLYSIGTRLGSNINSSQLNRKHHLVTELTKLKVDLPNQINSMNFDSTNNKIATIEAELGNIYDIEAESLFLQSGLKWREEGERSTKYFLGLVNKKRQETSVSHMRDAQGTLVVTIGGILDIAKNFYSSLYSRSPPTNNSTLLNKFLENSPTMDPAISENLEAPISIDELKKSLKTCKDSSPGPDGIPYSFYKSFDDLLLNPLLQSWHYSLEIGELPPSQSQACISLLPKAGKDKTRIENWRPISLSNCDIKLITKAIALRLNSVLDDIISTSQSAYIPGRVISNNVRILKVYRKYANLHRKQFSIVSLDARKAFDSVDHTYITEVLKKYGFGTNFIHTFKTLYNNNESTVLLNGYKSGKFKIERGVKQGDALSCGIFILAIDPLLRNIEKSENIIPIELTSNNRNRRTFLQKVLAYADDITVITAATQESIQAIFSQYEMLTNLSGLTLNAEKTEIINSLDNTQSYNIQYNGNTVHITPIESIIICGIKLLNNEAEEYEYNVCRRINDMETQLKNGCAET